MKGKLIRYNKIRRPVATFLNQLVNIGVTNPQSSEGPITQDSDCYLGFTTPCIGRRYGPRNLPGVVIDFFSHSSSGLCYALL